jgi:hypothetical protein
LYAEQQTAAELPQQGMKHQHSEQWQPITIMEIMKILPVM